MKMIKSIAMFTAVITFFALNSCKKSSGSGGSGSIKGKVVNETGSAVVGAIVAVGTVSVVTASDGTFAITPKKITSVSYLSATAPGYFIAYRNVQNIDGSQTSTSISMLTKTSAGTIPGTGGSVTGTGFTITTGANAFKSANGNAYTGTVNVAARYVAMDDPNLGNLMPGGDFTAIDAGGNAGMMHSFGFVATEFTASNGETLVPGGTVTICVNLPAPAGNPVDSNGTAWGFDPNTGAWTNSAAMTSSGGTACFNITTVYQNLDAFFHMGFIKGRIICSGKPKAFEPVTFSNKYDKYVSSTNANGYYYFPVDAVGPGFLYTITSGGATTTIGSPNKGQTVTAPDFDICASGTTTPTSLGAMACTVNGVAYTADSCICYGNTTGSASSGGTISGWFLHNVTLNGILFKDFIVNLNTVWTGGTGTFSLNNAVGGGDIQDTVTISPVHNDGPSIAGSMTILTVSATYVTGTFNFTLYDGTSVTSGSFTAKIE